MSKLIYLFTLLYFTVNYCYCQTAKDNNCNIKYNGEITIGTSVPMGNFGSKDFSNSDAGLAILGYSVFASYGPKYKNNLGFKVATSSLFNPMCRGVDNILNNIQSPNGTKLEYKYGQWYNINLLIGPDYYIPISESAINLRFLAGIMLSNSPYVKIDYYEEDVYIGEVGLNIGHGQSFVFDAGLGMIYNITNNLLFKLNIDYIYGYPKLDLSIYSKTADIYLSYKEYTAKQPISITNISIGFVFSKD